MSYELFKEYQKKEEEWKEIDNEKFLTEERFQKIEKHVKGFVTQNDLRG